MNYKIMQRPMFRLGGGVIKGKKVGDRENFATITEIENLIDKRAGLRDKALSSMSSMLPFQVLAGQGDNIRTIRSLGDVTDILSNLGTDPNTFAALGKLNAIDLKKTEGELSDKITLAKLKQSTNKKYEFERRLTAAKNISKQQESLLAGKSAAEQEAIRQTPKFKALQQEKNYLLRELSEKAYLLQRSAANELGFDLEKAKKDYDRITSEFSTGGRVG